MVLSSSKVMTAAKKKQNLKHLDRFPFVSKNGSAFQKGIEEITNSKTKTNNNFNLLYKLFLYSFVGFFAKIIIRLFKLFK